MNNSAALFPGDTPVVAVWFAINVLDSLLTCIALRMGATEMSISYQLTHSMVVSMGLKYLAVMMIIDILIQVRKITWLNWFVGGMIIVVAWNISQIISNI